MIQRRREIRPILLLSVALLLAWATWSDPAPARAQSGGGYNLAWNTIDGGGWTFSTGGSYGLGGTIGQADAGVLQGGPYALVGGFWGGALQTAVYGLHLPVVLRHSGA
jgi:hypothetical protein